MTITDIITLLFSAFFLARGFIAGFVNSLIPPFSIIIGTLISYFYYLSTKHMLTSLALGVLAPLFIYAVCRTILGIWSKATNTDMKPGFVSSMTGAVLNLLWGWVFIIATLILLALLPPMGKALTIVHNDITKSASYALAKPWQDAFLASQPKAAVPDNKTADGTSGAANAPAVQTLAQDARFKKVMNDPEIQHDIDSHNIIALMSNPKMMELTRQIMSDPETLKKVMAVYNSQQKPTASSAVVQQ
ncbi:MAG: CvpA family protein [Candidatus Omnitrophica bacterium]|nr:CvpA family protein [Candidatus Omnitrophota bacterium]MDE2222119.1 CvpA family protein [Candidatus Omnitrophota bacterium]